MGSWWQLLVTNTDILLCICSVNVIICCVWIENILFCNFDFIIVINSDESRDLNFNCSDDDDNEGINANNEFCKEYDIFHPIVFNISIVIKVLLL